MEYCALHNRFRPHSSLGKRTPDEAYVEMLHVVEMAV
jgi:putative transposase